MAQQGVFTLPDGISFGVTVLVSVRLGEMRRRVSVLDVWQASPMGIYAEFPQRRCLPLRVRLFIELLRETYAQPAYWEVG